MCVLDGFEFGFAVRHAAGEIRHDRDKAAAIRLGKPLNFDVVNWSLADVSVSQKGYQALDIYWLNRSLERDGQNLLLPGLETL